MCEYMQHPNKHTCNIRLKKEMKHWEQTFITYVYNHCNIYNITIYFCNIHMKYLQHTFETCETLETCAFSKTWQSSGRSEGGWQRMGGCADPGDREHMVPAVEAHQQSGGAAPWRYGRSGDGEEGRCGRDVGAREPHRSRPRSRCVIFFNLQ